jgi:hypothetical protein
MVDKIVYCDLSRDFEIIRITQQSIILFSVKHHVLMTTITTPHNNFFEPPFRYIGSGLCNMCGEEGSLTTYTICARCCIVEYCRQQLNKK